MADRLVIMDQGKIALQGVPREVFSQIKTLKKLRLDVPQVTELAQLLQKELPHIPSDILTIEEMVMALCP